jgi:7,8-dihydropterin-6-yl-methyl-4-(beta-D-ribofuranosyl)aminobenzene 5'-phosphate synthase
VKRYELGRDGKLPINSFLAEHALCLVVTAKVGNESDFARKLTGNDRVYAVIGGYHLSGEPFRDALRPTLDALREFGPQVLVPMHCTGVEAKSLLQQEMPDRAQVSGVGTTFILPLP